MRQTKFDCRLPLDMLHEFYREDRSYNIVNRNLRGYLRDALGGHEEHLEVGEANAFCRC